MYPEWILQESIDVTAQPGALGFEDLHIKPVSFGQKANEYVADVNWLYNSHEETK